MFISGTTMLQVCSIQSGYKEAVISQHHKKAVMVIIYFYVLPSILVIIEYSELNTGVILG